MATQMLETRNIFFALFLSLLFASPAGAYDLPETGQVGSHGVLKLTVREDTATVRRSADYRFRFHFEDGSFEMRLAAQGAGPEYRVLRGTTEPLGHTGRKLRLLFDEPSTTQIALMASGRNSSVTQVRRLKAVVKLAPESDEAYVRFVAKVKRAPEAEDSFRSAAIRYKGVGFASDALLNPGAEKGLQHWSPDYAGMTTTTSRVYSGELAFWGGSDGRSGRSAGAVRQLLDVEALARRIDDGEVDVLAGAALLSNQNTSGTPDRAVLLVSFHNEVGFPVGDVYYDSPISGNYYTVGSLVRVPVGTRSVVVEIYTSRPSGRSTDGYADDVDVAFLPAHENAGLSNPPPMPL